MRFTRLALAAASLAATGCMTTSGGLQTAQTLAPQEWQITGGASLPVSTRFVAELADLIDQAVESIDDASQGEPLSAEDEREILVSALGLLLFQPSPITSMAVRRGLIENVDAGVRWAGPALRVDAKWQLHAPAEGPAIALDLGITHHTGVGSSLATSVFDLFESLRLVTYSRQDVDLNLLVSADRGRRLGWFGAVRYAVGFIDIETLLDEAVETEEPLAIRDVSSTMHQLGGSAGLRLGTERLALLVELTVMRIVFEPEVLGATTDLGGWIIEPAAGISGSF